MFRKNPRTNKTIKVLIGITAEDYNISPTLFDEKFSSERFKNFSAKRVTEVYNNNSIDKSSIQQSVIPDVKIEKKEFRHFRQRAI
jgi:two-component system phosphate regulon sensor histidine kinase PhoR